MSIDPDEQIRRDKAAKRALQQSTSDPATSLQPSLYDVHRQSRSSMMLYKIRKNGSLDNEPKRTVRLVIFGSNEMFGLDEIIEQKKKRDKTVECISLHGTCHFLSKEYFIHCANQFKFSDQVLQEQLVKHQMYCRRLEQTYAFQRKFLSQQRDMLKILLADEEARQD